MSAGKLNLEESMSATFQLSQSVKDLACLEESVQASILLSGFQSLTIFLPSASPARDVPIIETLSATEALYLSRGKDPVSPRIRAPAAFGQDEPIAYGRLATS